jgi:tetratricopeptide (TPR) repeat protein
MNARIDDLAERGRLAVARRDYAAALADFREVLRERPEYADIRHLAGLCLSFLDQPAAALEEFDRALELNPKYVEAHLNRAITLNELGRYEEAKEAFRLAGEYETARGGRFPGAVSARLANAHMALADLYMEAGDPASAEAEYRRGLELRPEFLDIRNKLAQALLRRGEYAAAETELRRVLESNPNFLAARVNLGLVYFRRGDRAAAEREWRACQAQAPEHPQARAYLAMLDSSGLFQPSGDVES